METAVATGTINRRHMLWVAVVAAVTTAGEDKVDRIL